MVFRARYYFVGIVVATAFLLVFWIFHPPTYAIHSVAPGSALMNRLWNGENKKLAFIDVVQRHLSTADPETERMKVDKREKNKNEDEREIDRENEERLLDIKDGEDKPDKEYEEENSDVDDSKEGEDMWRKISKEMSNLAVGRNIPETVKELEMKPPSKSMTISEGAGKETKGKKYLFYRCGVGENCSGFADRQRAIVGLYLMSLATNRTFGVIMKHPASLEDFYVPNKVNWDINPMDLEGKSFISIRCGAHCNFTDFNTLFPQDIVYVLSRSDFLQTLGLEGTYRQNLPDWALGSISMSFGRGWTTLMKPTHVLRDDVNSLLLKIASDMHQDVKIIPKIKGTDSCVTACNEILIQEKNQSQSIDECLQSLDGLKKHEHRERINFLRHICPVEAAIPPPSPDTIKSAVEYDYVELNLVCAQIRLGKNPSLHKEPVLNRIEDVYKIWDVIRPYVNKGHHIFLASDSQEVRDQGREMFGARIHVNTGPIVHINKVGRQDPWQGMKTALMEQLVLSTSCKVLVYCNTGFGLRAAMVRQFLTRDKEGFKTYEFHRRRVRSINFDRKSRKLPVKEK